MRKFIPVILFSFIPLTGCSSSSDNAEMSETASPAVLLSIEEKSQLKFCDLVEKAYESYENSSLWWIIACANNIHDAPMGLEDGTILRIPQNYIQIQNIFTQ